MTKRRDVCRDCGLTEAEAGSTLSRQGYCLECGTMRAMGAHAAMVTKSGPAWEKWLSRQKAFLESQSK